MPKLRLRITWATPIAVEVLGARVEAYVSQQPTINILRLCNRYGQGKKATVTKLPVELIQKIEEYVVQAMGEDVLPRWQQQFRCWKGVCTPVEHMSACALADFQCTILDDKQSIEGAVSDCNCAECSPGSFQDSTPDVDKIDEMMAESRDCNPDDDVYAKWWRPEHASNIWQWQLYTGIPGRTTTCRLERSDYVDVLLKHFGLETWTSHTQLPVHPVNPDRWPDTSIVRSTIAYLCMPDGHNKSLHWSIESGQEPDDEEPDGYAQYEVPSECAIAEPLTLPTTPESKVQAYFSRALQILGLEALPSSNGKKYPQQLVLASDGAQNGIW